VNKKKQKNFIRFCWGTNWIICAGQKLIKVFCFFFFKEEDSSLQLTCLFWGSGQMELAGEFKLIDKYFRPLAGPEALDLADDAAVFAVSSAEEIVISTDAMVEHTHFLPGADAGLLARKLLRVNLSDLAAMGARPLGYLLTLCLPKTTSGDWLQSFADGLALDQDIFNLRLWGGDTTSTRGPVVVSITILGATAQGQAVRRNGARPGDLVYVTGTIGDGLLGLAAARGEIADADGYLAGRYNLPTPRNALALAGIASAAMDVSDGLIQELEHLARASGVAITVRAMDVPLSPQAEKFRDRLPQLLSGGDDYELLFTLPPAREAALLAATKRAGVPVTRIGWCEAGEAGVTLLDQTGAPMAIAATGWSHF
jgi:thiamine-monophosphate kinase